MYEDDAFYKEADEHGILIWQDFIFACTTYPSDPAFLKRVEAEADYNIKRLRNHASLAMWCGNNEIYELFQSAWSGASYISEKEEEKVDDRVYLVNDLGFSCIKYFVIFNEPDGNWASTNGDYEM